MKYIFMIITFALVFTLFITIPWAEETVFQAVYCVDEKDSDHDKGFFEDIEDAIAHVEDKGVVYLDKDINILSTINLDKSIEIISKPPNNYKIGFFADEAAFNLEESKSIEYFKLVGIRGESSYKVGISGAAKRIDIINSSFFACTPIKIINPTSNMDIYISESKFNKTMIDIDLGGAEGTIDFLNNKFQERNETEDTSNSISLKNIDVTANNNRFKNTGFIIDGSRVINVDITNNTFDEGNRRIYIKIDGTNMSFKYNKILDKSITAEVYYDGATPIDFTQNWWGSGYGPKADMIGGDGKEYVDYNNWALFEDFSRYSNGPYVLDDLAAAIDNLGQAIDERNFLYDFDNNNEIELIDLIWLTRSIE